jgi:protein disulfide-isomerase
VLPPWFAQAALLAAGLLGLGFSLNAAEWSTDLPSSLTRATGENRLVLINFTGSDWCPACMRLKERLASPEFTQFAEKNLFLVEVDFPRNKAQSAAQQRANETLARKYGVDSYPTLLLLSGDGIVVAKVELYTSPAVFVSHLKEQVEANSPLAALSKGKKAAAAEPLPLFGGAPSGPPPKYADLTLKSVTGPKNRRLALINNQTFAPGEGALVRLGDGQVKVRCLEINDKSVVVTIEGKRRELPLVENF